MTDTNDSAQGGTQPFRRELVCELIAAIMKQPRTIESAIEMTGAPLQTTMLWFESLRESGLIRISERLPRVTSEGTRQHFTRRLVWQWQSTPFAEADIAP